MLGISRNRRVFSSMASVAADLDSVKDVLTLFTSLLILSVASVISPIDDRKVRATATRESVTDHSRRSTNVATVFLGNPSVR
jgi:hypothetical protein